MKLIVFFAVILLSVNLSLQIPKLVNCPPDFVLTSSMADTCGVLTCREDNSIIVIGCGVSQCLPDKFIEYKEEDNSKPFPECCGRPICAD